MDYIPQQKFGEYILDPTEDRLWILNSVVMGMGVDFKF